MQQEAHLHMKYLPDWEFACKGGEGYEEQVSA